MDADTQGKAQDAAGQAQEKAQEAAGQARDQIRTQVDERSTQAGEQVSTHASDLRAVADQLREQGKDQPAKLAAQAADRAERLGGYLTDADADRILADLEDFGRRQPMAFMLGGLALGFAASRLLKASSQNRSSSGNGSNGNSSRQPRAELPRTTPEPVPSAVPSAAPGAPGAGYATPPAAPAPPVTPPHPAGNVR